MIFYTSSNIYCSTRAATINLFKQQNFGNKKLFTTGSSNKNKMYKKLIKRKHFHSTDNDDCTSINAHVANVSKKLCLCWYIQCRLHVDNDL